MSASVIAASYVDTIVPMLRDVKYCPLVTDSTTLALTQPSGLQVGDIMVAWTQQPFAATLPGWYPLSTTTNTGVNVASSASGFWRVATAADVSSWSHTITFATAYSGNACISAWYNCSGVEVNNGVSGNNNTTLTELAYTTLTPNAMVLHLAGTRNSLTPPTVTRGTDLITGSTDGPSSGGDFGLRATYEVQAAAGAGGLAGNTGGGNGKAIHTVALTPFDGIPAVSVLGHGSFKGSNPGITVTLNMTPPAGAQVVLAIRQSFGAAFTVAGLGATWTRIGGFSTTEIWIGTGCSGSGNTITVSTATGTTIIASALVVSGITASGAQFAGATTGTAIGPLTAGSTGGIAMMVYATSGITTAQTPRAWRTLSVGGDGNTIVAYVQLKPGEVAGGTIPVTASHTVALIAAA